MGEVSNELILEETKTGLRSSNPGSSNSFDDGAETSSCGICSGLVLNRGVLDCCTHWFCFTCIDDWATVTNLCPLCKARFRFITCLPVGCHENGIWEDAEHIGSGLARRQEGSDHVDTNLPFSFPSYFIDEEAVVCLEGDACRVRSGFLLSDDETALAADTSVACDRCDCWYHAGCVNFDPDQASFFCPRCVASQEKAGNSLDPVKSGTPVSSAGIAVALAGALPAEELTYGGGTLVGSTSVAITVAEEGESAVSISMRRIPDPSAQPCSQNVLDESLEIWSPIREPVNSSQSYGVMWSPIREPLVIPKEYGLWSPTREPVDQFQNPELWSPTPDPVKASSFREQEIVLPVVSGRRLDPTDSLTKNHNTSKLLTSNLSANSVSGQQQLRRGSAMTLGEKRKLPADFPTTTKNFRRPEELSSSTGVIKDEDILIDVNRLQVAVEQLKRGKRKVLQEDERKVDFKDLPEPPRQVVRKSTRKSDASEGRSLAVRKDFSNKVPDDDNTIEITDNCQSKVPSSMIMRKDVPKGSSKDTSKGRSVRERDSQKIDCHQHNVISQANKQKTPAVELEMQDGADMVQVSAEEDTQKIDDHRSKGVSRPSKQNTAAVELKIQDGMEIGRVSADDTQKIVGDQPKGISTPNKETTPAVELKVQDGMDIVKVSVEEDSQKIDGHLPTEISKPNKQKTKILELTVQDDMDMVKVSVEESQKIDGHLPTGISNPNKQKTKAVELNVQDDMDMVKVSVEESQKIDGHLPTGISKPNRQKTKAVELKVQDHMDTVKVSVEEDSQKIDGHLPTGISKPNKQNTKVVESKISDSIDTMKESMEEGTQKVDDQQHKGTIKPNKQKSPVVGLTPQGRDVKVTLEENATQKIDSHRHKVTSRLIKQKTPAVVLKPPDIMDIVKDRTKDEKSNIQKGVRTRIIMHRETGVKDKVTPSLVERIRQQIKDTAGYGAGEEVKKVEVSDDRFIAAFKAALARSHEKNKEVKPTASSQRKAWLAKVLNQRTEGKGSRDSLTRKLYGGGTSRWDRDWDIAFWKERSANLRRAQKEAEDEIDGKGMHGSGDNESDPEEKDSIFTRLYIADTSLFPRSDDVKPLSALVKNTQDSETSKTKPVKGTQVHLDKSNANLAKNQLLHSLSTTKQASENSSVMSDLLGVRVTATPAPSKEGSGRGKGIDMAPKSGVVVQPQASTTSKTSSNGSESTTLKSDVKKDKRQWALDVLARKTGNSANASATANTTGGSTDKDTQFALLVQLPLDMRPLMAHNRHSKVPSAVRQVQVNRLVEQELRMAKLSVIQNSPECQDAVNRGKAREEELYKKSNSKGVYVNLCVRALAQAETVVNVKQDSESESDVHNAIQKALEATGLVASPPTSPDHEKDACSAVSINKEAEAPSVDIDHKSNKCQDKWVENVLEMDNLDIYGDFEFNPDNDLEDSIFSENTRTSKLEAATEIQEPDNRTNKMMVVLTTASCQSNSAPGSQEVLPETVLGTDVLEERVGNADTHAGPVPTSDAGAPLVGHREDDDLYSGLEFRLNSIPTSAGSLVTSEDNATPSIVSSKTQLSLSPASQDLKSVGSASEALEKSSEGSKSPTQAGDSSMDDWMNTDKFADLDRRIENIRQNTSPGNRGIDVPWKCRVPAGAEPANTVQKQVEIYVNQHLKPLYRSGVIKAEEFRYAVSKTATKVMEHHANASSADFLITEGSKVKKLADDYLKAFKKRKAS